MGPAPWQLRALSALLPLGLTYLVFDRSLLTAHVLCNSVAFLLLFPEGTLLATHNLWLRRPVRAFTGHVVAQMTALMLSLLGAGAMLLHQHAKNAPHFASPHSWLGVSALLCAEFAGLFGALAFSGALQLPADQLAIMRVLHRLLGRLALLLSSVAMLLGLHVFDTQHPRHQGWRTYAVAIALGVHAVGMQSVLWYTMPLFNGSIQVSSFWQGSRYQNQGDATSRTKGEMVSMRPMPPLF